MLLFSRTKSSRYILSGWTFFLLPPEARGKGKRLDVLTCEEQVFTRLLDAIERPSTECETLANRHWSPPPIKFCLPDRSRHQRVVRRSENPKSDLFSVHIISMCGILVYHPSVPEASCELGLYWASCCKKSTTCGTT